MKFEIVEIENLCAEEAMVYSISLTNEDSHIFLTFLKTFYKEFPDEISKITNRIKIIGNTTGAREDYFKHNEGKMADGVCALYDDPDRKMRLYCIRLGKGTLILGRGGPKPPEIRKWQQCPVLSGAANQIIKVAQLLNVRIQSKEIQFQQNKLIGNLKFED